VGEPTRLIDKLKVISSDLNNSNIQWVTFVQDHLKYIRANGIVITITDEIRDRFRTKFDHFLRENNCEQNIWWIASILNDVTDYADFTLKDTVVIPDRGYILNLYRKYRTSINV
jgi:hypothetical protein